MDDSTRGVDTVMRIALDSRQFFKRLIENPRDTLEELRAITREDVDQLVSIIETRRSDTTLPDALMLWDDKHMLPGWNPGDWPILPWPHRGGPGGPPHSGG